jgi:hypothetical protein
MVLRLCLERGPFDSPRLRCRGLHPGAMLQRDVSVLRFVCCGGIVTGVHAVRHPGRAKIP